MDSLNRALPAGDKADCLGTVSFSVIVGLPRLADGGIIVDKSTIQAEYQVCPRCDIAESFLEGRMLRRLFRVPGLEETQNSARRDRIDILQQLFVKGTAVGKAISSSLDIWFFI